MKWQFVIGFAGFSDDIFKDDRLKETSKSVNFGCPASADHRPFKLPSFACQVQIFPLKVVVFEHKEIFLRVPHVHAHGDIRESQGRNY